MALSLMFHMIFAALGIALPLLLVIAEALYLRTGSNHYLELARKWAKATGLLFVIGAISGTALAFELGLLWPRYMELTGAAVGHAFALEGYAGLPDTATDETRFAIRIPGGLSFLATHDPHTTVTGLNDSAGEPSHGLWTPPTGN